MKKILLVLVLLALPVFAAEQTWENVTVVDTMCLSKVKDNPDKHEAKCLVQCAPSGLGILTADGYLKLDDKGSEKAITLIKESGKKDNLRVNVTGTRDGDTIQVTSVTLP